MCLRHICTHLAVYKLLQEEIDEYYKKKNLSEPISYSQTLEIPYLKAVISESLRLTPSIPFQLLRYLPKGGISIDGHYIPAGYSIGVSAIAQNHDQSVFGQDADQFRPERYLESAERTSSMESATMTWGGSGSRACIGKNIALVRDLQLSVAIVTFLVLINYRSRSTNSSPKFCAISMSSWQTMAMTTMSLPTGFHIFMI
jgi:cytochrome P450